MTNCKNCGAVIDLSADKCPYCDTPYIDILENRRLQNEELKRSAQLIMGHIQSQDLYVEAIRTMRMYWGNGEIDKYRKAVNDI